MTDPLAENMEALNLSTKPRVEPAEESDDFVDPWNVASKSDKGIDYDKLISKPVNVLYS